RFALGVGIQWPRLTVELDESIGLGMSTAIQSSMDVTTTRLVNGVSTTSTSSPTFTVPMHATANTAIGAEYFLTPSFSLLGGMSTSFSSLSALSPDTGVGNLVQTKADHVTLAFGIGSYGGVGYILMGTQLDYGWGEALVANPYTLPNTWAVLGTHTYGALFVLSGTTRLRAIEHAIVKVTNAVTTGRPEEPVEAPPRPAGPGQPPAAPPAPAPRP